MCARRCPSLPPSGEEDLYGRLFERSTRQFYEAFWPNKVSLGDDIESTPSAPPFRELECVNEMYERDAMHREDTNRLRPTERC
mmetsp:Transcript_32843/g.81353  ORF Transcript_32843/g.81353 Transcript_32843/m.81353 type:complete len:83 (-) Transcript_32843:148-396(-)